MLFIGEMNIFTKVFKDQGETKDGITTEIYRDFLAIRDRDSVSVDTCWMEPDAAGKSGYETAVIRRGMRRMRVEDRVFKSFAAAKRFHAKVVAGVVKAEEARLEREMWAEKYHKG